MNLKRKPIIGVIVANRGVFPDRVAREGRRRILSLLEKEGVNFVYLSEKEGRFGTSSHTQSPSSQEFLEDLRRFLAISRTVKGLRRARIGLIGTRPLLFNRVRFSEKILPREGIAVEPVDLSELLGKAKKKTKRR